MSPRLWPLVLVAALSVTSGRHLLADVGHDGAAALDATQAAPGEQELFGRLVAPCCWNQTLDIHGGAVPDQLRAEIRRRLHAGEAPAAIEADFVARYGERVKAQSSSTLLGSAGLLVIGLGLLAGVGVVLAVRRWLRASQRTLPTASAASKPDAWDARLDDELRALD